MPLKRLIFGLCAMLLAGACGDGNTPPPPPPTATIGLSPVSVAFSDSAGTSNPAPATVAVSNLGSLPLTGLAVGSISYGAGASGWITAALNGSQAPVALTIAASNAGLVAGTYTATIPIGSGGASNSPQSVVVTYSLAEPPPAILLAGGDIASCSQAHDEATAVILDNEPGLVAALGDLAYPNGSPDEYANCYEPSWGRHKARTRPAVGNHDYQTANAIGYFGYFGGAAGDPDKGYYSYNHGAWHIVVLNSNIDATDTSPQMAWLQQDLAGAPNRCTLAYWHHPRFTSTTAARQSTTGRMAVAVQRLYDAGADVVLTAHDHFYERLAPMDPTGANDPARGIRHFVSGMAGSDASSGYAFGTIFATSEFRQNTTTGVLKLTLWSDRYAWQFLGVAGATTIDTGTGTCH